ncbi:hypothetical protein, partial [Mycoplana rhizolycopersici]|uniref:hypothetical protein n=1 Tax=Mycoplana rhizolycopersici TaxID=2746702 RepID=UPI001AED59CE
ACLVLLQYTDNLFVRETVALHPLVLSMAQSLLQNGLGQRGKVSLVKVRIWVMLLSPCEPVSVPLELLSLLYFTPQEINCAGTKIST